MKKYLLIISFLLLISCSEEPIYYKYNGVTVTRIDRNNEIFLYYGYYKKNDKLPESYVKGSCTCDALDCWFEALLMFNPNKTVTVIRSDGWFDKHGNDSLISLRQYWDNIGNISYEKWEYSIEGNFQNVIRIRNNIEYEIDRNTKDKQYVDRFVKADNSKVTAIYPK